MSMAIAGYINSLLKNYPKEFRNQIKTDFYNVVERTKHYHNLTIEQQKQTVDDTEIEFTDEKVVKVVKASEVTHITKFDSIPTTNYDKAMRFIHDHKGIGWFSITEIPIDYYRDFMSIADIRKDIIFDSDREDQFLKIL